MYIIGFCDNIIDCFTGAGFEFSSVYLVFIEK